MSEKSIINQLNELVMFRQPVRTVSTKGQVNESFQDFRKALMKVEPAGGSEEVEGERINLAYQFTMTGHNYSDVNETFRVLYEGSEYNILSIERMPRRLFMKIKLVKVFK